MTTKFGFQCQFDSGDAERYNRELQPTHVMVINVVKREFLARLKADNPNVKLVYRHWPNYDWQNPTPEEAARQAVAQLQAEIAPVRDLLTYITDNNEYILSKDHMTPADIEAGDCYMAAFIKAARQVLGLGTCWGNFNTGHWGAETVDYFPRALAAANDDGDSLICFHEYNWPTIPDPGFWTCGKVLRAMPPIVAQYPDVRCMVTEFGVDDGGNPHKGWSLAFEDIDVAADIFCDGIAWYRDEVIAKAPWLDAVLFFGCGMVSPWESFDVAPIIDDIKAIVGMMTPPEPPNGGTKMKVFNRDGQELTGQAATDMVAYYSLSFEAPPGLADGDLYFALVALREKTGDSAFIHHILDTKGDPIQAADIRAFWWPNMSGDDNDVTEKWPTDIWHPDADLGETNERGEGGSGMGKGAYHAANMPGPHHAWVRHPQYKSTILRGVGMIAGTFHDHMDGEWKLMAYVGTTPPSPSGDPVTRLRQVATELNAIADGLATSGVVTTVTVTYSGGQQVVFKPSLAAGVMRAVRSVFGR